MGPEVRTLVQRVSGSKIRKSGGAVAERNATKGQHDVAGGEGDAARRALAAAEGTVIAYTDDDVAVDPLWVHGLVRGFRRRSDVWCVTGLVGTASIRTSAPSGRTG